MSTTKICNAHERRIAAGPEPVWELLLTMSGPDDLLWPRGVPTLRFDGPLAVGAQGGHSPIRYELTSLQHGAPLAVTYEGMFAIHEVAGAPASPPRPRSTARTSASPATSSLTPSVFHGIQAVALAAPPTFISSTLETS